MKIERKSNSRWVILLITTPILLLTFIFQEYPKTRANYWVSNSILEEWTTYDNWTVLITLFLCIGVSLLIPKAPKYFIEIEENNFTVFYSKFSKEQFKITDIDFFYEKEHPFDRSFLQLKSGKKIHLADELVEKREFKKLLNDLRITSK